MREHSALRVYACRTAGRYRHHSESGSNALARHGGPQPSIFFSHFSYGVPLILNGSLGVQTNQFSFTVSWATNLNVVVEAVIDLGNPIWSPVATNSLVGGWFYFTDPARTNYPSRFYRVRSQ
jgi:hypothetical protein